METDLGKLFIGGISWDTDEKRLKEYFGQYGEVVEAMIMKDRISGRARGFGFVVFADPTDTEKVVMEKHMIDGRTVEAKRAVPMEDQHNLTRNNNSNQGSPGLARVKKIFVGGLASTLTESDFKKYFDKFGTITDVVVMYDHNTQRPRGFGFITYDSEDAVDRVLFKTFHELNGKMVEVKRAVPKEPSSSPNRSPLGGYNNYGLSRAGSFISSCPHFSSIGGYGRFNPIAGGRRGFLPFGTTGYGISTNMEPGFSANYGTNSTHVRLLSPYFNGSLGGYNSSIRCNGGIDARNDALFSSTSQNVWGSRPFNNATNPTNSAALLGFEASFGANFANWNSSPLTSQAGGGGASGYVGGNLGYAFGGSNCGPRVAGYGRNTGSKASLTSSLSASSGALDSSYRDLYRGSSVYGDSTWGVPEIEGSGSFGFGLANAGSEVASKTSEGYMGSYAVTNRQANRGVAA